MRLGAAREDGDAVPAFLAVPDRAVTGLFQLGMRKFFVRRLQFLKADHVRRGQVEPAQQDRQPAVDAVDVEGANLHSKACFIQ